MLDLADEQLIDAEIDAFPTPGPTPVHGRRGQIILGASLVLIAFNLRPVFSSLSAVLPEVMRDDGITPAGASLMTTLPVLCLGLFAPLAPRLALRFGAERSIIGLLALLALGTALRGLATVPALLLGSILAGAGIAAVNVLLPGLVKRDFQPQAALMTGMYTMALCAGAASAAGFTVPLQRLFGSWSLALAAWALPVLAVLLLWIPQALVRPAAGRSVGFIVRGLWRDPLAWQVTLFMGLQSALAYCVFGWLAPILRERGLSGVNAGLVVSVSVLAQMAACLTAPSLAVRCKDQRGINVIVVGMAVLGLLGCLFAPLSSVWLWAVLQGAGQGSLIAVAMTLIVLRSPDAHVAAHLSSMAQTVGYVLAAGGPLMVGLIHGWTGGFNATGALFVLIGLGAAAAGLGAGRVRHVRVRLEGPLQRR
ncbi:CynX/NimT family MFS transporter [Undibacterium arcticum]|uniref:CynX/NimT family MFS transporter n=1 Tax=Undibacterium arcticum TaxID=1762892 RepID=UPI00360A5523